MIRIRAAGASDSAAVRRLCLAAFGEDENQRVSELAVRLLSEQTTPETLSLVAERDGAVVGYLGLSPVACDAAGDWQGYILVPLAVTPEFHGQGIGRQLVEAGKEILTARAVDTLFVYGDPKYYGRFGFGADPAAAYRPPHALAYPFGWQLVSLQADTADREDPVQLSVANALCDPTLW